MGRSALAGGLVLGAMSVTWAVASFFGGRLMVRTTYRLTAVLGTLALIAGSAVLITLTPERGVAWASAGSSADRHRHGAVQHDVHRIDPGGGARGTSAVRPRRPACSCDSSGNRWGWRRSAPC